MPPWRSWRIGTAAARTAYMAVDELKAFALAAPDSGPGGAILSRWASRYRGALQRLLSHTDQGEAVHRRIRRNWEPNSGGSGEVSVWTLLGAYESGTRWMYW